MYILSNDQKYFDVSGNTVFAGFGTRKLGDGRDPHIINDYFKDRTIVKPKQSHSTTIVEYKSGDDHSPYGDGVVTKEKNVLLTIITADCLSILYHDPITKIIGISHQGWKGTLNHLPSLMIEKMIRLGSSPENIQCYFGPAINDCCYEIFGDRLTDFHKEFKSDFIFRKENEKYFLNLYKANYLLLSEFGIKNQNIHYFPFCTSCDSKKFYSYNRDHVIIGEMMSFILL
jgi:hypothetical protein